MKLYIQVLFILIMIENARAQNLGFPEKSLEISEITIGDLAASSDTSSAQAAGKVGEFAERFLKDIEKTVVPFPRSCSGVFISDEGHLVTALHCLESLFIGGPNPLDTSVLRSSQSYRAKAKLFG